MDRPRDTEGNGSIESFSVVGCGRTEFASGLCCSLQILQEKALCIVLLSFRYTLISGGFPKFARNFYFKRFSFNCRSPLATFCEYIGQGVS